MPRYKGVGTRETGSDIVDKVEMRDMRAFGGIRRD
jgi:hypothetical protein